MQLEDTRDVAGLTALRGRAIQPAPITGNLEGRTVVLGQYKQRSGSDGHFVVFDHAIAARQAANFLGTLAHTGMATVVE